MINYTREEFAHLVNELTGGQGVDLILDAVAGEVFSQGLTCLTNFGRIVMYGISSNTPGQAALNQLHPTNRAVIGYSTGHYLQQGSLRLMIGGRFPLELVAEAHRLVGSRQSVGKVLLVP